MAEFRLPDLGEGVTEGEVLEWRVREGDAIELDQILGVIGTDKATVEIPSPFAGRVESILVAEGARIPVGEILLRVAGGEEGVGEAASRRATAGASRPRFAPAAPATEAQRVPALPSVRRAARSRGIALPAIAGSGPGGRVRLEDLLDQGRRVPLRGPARVMAEQMARTHRHVPQVTVVLELDVTALESRLAKGETEGPTPPTLLGLICLAILRELAEAPVFNSSLDEENLELILHDHVQLGIAVQTDQGLRVATIRDAELLTPAAFHGELARVVSAARAGTLTAGELSGSTFTVSSGGRQGGLLATPLVNWPNVAILGIHAVQDRAVVVDGQVVVGRRANLSLSFDHRVIDGMAASRLLYQLEARLTSEGD
ncbi:MAG TPA: dihydrolipoamide acetyltransferase family protein [Candidatus Micrarchaeaceae archaeon]|nr:dihydrolipoamide acetyltransferase family protein [Candidatus Micrarchaeaceae archaeon]